MELGRLVAPMTMTCARVLRPSISVSSCDTMRRSTSPCVCPASLVNTFRASSFISAKNKASNIYTRRLNHMSDVMCSLNQSNCATDMSAHIRLELCHTQGKAGSA